MNFFQDSYPETSNTQNSFYSTSSLVQTTPPLSSTPTSSIITPISVPPLRPKKILSMTAQEFVPTTPPGFKHHQQQGSFGQGNECGFAGGNNRQYGGYIGGGPMPINCSLLNNSTTHNQLLLRQQQIFQEKQHLIQKQQQNLVSATIAKQQLVLSAAAVANHPQDEISNSLKMFAVLSACKGNETPPSSEDVMQDFATNGYTTDEMNKYQPYQGGSNVKMYGNSNATAYDRRFNYYENNRNFSNNVNWLYNQQQLLHENINAYNELWRQNFLSMLPHQITATAVNVAAAANVDFSSQNARPHKRIQFKKDGQIAIRRCVFCENNNEPEAVVKSHAVRDSHGRVLCPKLRIYVCPICGASGDDAHTVKYCPQKPIITMEDAIKAESNRFSKGKLSQMPM